MNMDIEKIRNKMEKVDVELRKRIRDERKTIDGFSMEEYMTERGEALCSREQMLKSSAQYLSYAIQHLLAAEQISG